MAAFLLGFLSFVRNLYNQLKIGTCSSFPILDVYYPARTNFHCLVMAGIMNKQNDHTAGQYVKKS